MKLTKMMVAAYTPNAMIGIIGLKALERKATAVVLEVIDMARTARFHE